MCHQNMFGPENVYYGHRKYNKYLTYKYSHVKKHKISTKGALKLTTNVLNLIHGYQKLNPMI